VANIATLENFQALMAYLRENKLHCEVIQANISRLDSISMYTRFVPLDQIYIIKVRKSQLPPAHAGGLFREGQHKS